MLSLLSGVREGEALPLTWDHVYLSTQDGIPAHVAVWRSVRKHGDTKITGRSCTEGAEAMDEIFADDDEADPLGA